MVGVWFSPQTKISDAHPQVGTFFSTKGFLLSTDVLLLRLGRAEDKEVEVSAREEMHVSYEARFLDRVVIWGRKIRFPLFLLMPIQFVLE